MPACLRAPGASSCRVRLHSRGPGPQVRLAAGRCAPRSGEHSAFSACFLGQPLGVGRVYGAIVGRHGPNLHGPRNVGRTSVHPNPVRHMWIAALLFAAGCETPYCADTCRHALDGECDDGRPGAVTGLCGLGTDCSDCGANPTVTLMGDPPPRRPTLPSTGLPIIRQSTISVGGSCGCVADLYCAGPTSVEACADQLPNNTPAATPCTTSAMNCPGWDDNRVDYVCDDRPSHGVGCYAVANQYCDLVGTCANGTRNEGQTIEYCVQMPEFVGHFNTQQNLGRLLLVVEECEAWYQVGAARASCGACGAGCNVFLTGGPNPCEMDAGPGPNQFACGNGRNISRARVCNNTDDCGNGRDEQASMCNSQTGCCVATNGCPSETGSSCDSTCCCCPGGQRCCPDPSQGCCAV